MKKQNLPIVLLAAVAVVGTIGLPVSAVAQDESAAQAGEKTGVEGQYIRVAENDEGWVVVGYDTANESVGQKWMLLNVGITLQKGVESYKLTRDDIYLVDSDNKIIPLPSQGEYLKADLRGLDARANMQSNSVNYFPPSSNVPCRIGFFADSSTPGRTLAYDQVDLSNNRDCLGRVYFQIPDGIQYGLYNLDVKFANSTVRVPIKIMTKEEAKAFEQQWKEERKEEKKK